MKDDLVATVMRRNYIGPGVFVFSCSHTVLGSIDEESGYFVDRNGNYFPPMMTMDAISSASPYCCSNVVELSELKNDFSDCRNTREAIVAYEKNCRDAIFIVAVDDNNKLRCLIFDINSLIALGDNNDSKFQITDMAELEELINNNMNESDEDDMSEDIKQLIMGVVNGDYSLSELKELRNDLIKYYDDIEQAIDTIELQVEATIKGESFITLANERKKEEEQELLEYKKKYDKKIKKDSNKVGYQIVAPDINRKKLLRQVTKTLIAQDEPAERVITEIARKELEDSKKREGILLTGSTGVGKTELMRLIAKYLNKPFFIVDSTQLTIPGYTGRDIEEVLWELYVKCGEDKDLAESAIIYFDEIDKKGSGRKSDVSGQGVLNCLLPFIEGTTYQAKEDSKSSHSIEISTNNMTVILGGAFTSVYKNLSEKKGIGFVDTPTTTVRREPTTSDFVEKGLMTDEFMGRVTVVKLNDLSVDDLVRIMRESDQSAMRKQENLFKRLGTRIVFTDDYTRTIAEEAFKKKTGARGLNGIIDGSTWKAFGEVYDNPGEYEEVILDKESALDPSKYQLVKRKLTN